MMHGTTNIKNTSVCFANNAGHLNKNGDQDTNSVLTLGLKFS